MKRIGMIAILAIAAFALVSCNQANKAAGEIKGLLTDAGKALDDATKDMNAATDGKSIADALQKFTTWEKDFSTKSGKLDAKYAKTDLDKMSDKKAGELADALVAFGNSYTNFSNSLQAAITTYGADETAKAALTLAGDADMDLKGIFASVSGN